MPDFETWMAEQGYTTYTIYPTAIAWKHAKYPGNINDEQARAMYAAACRAYEAGHEAAEKSKGQKLFTLDRTGVFEAGIDALVAKVEWPNDYPEVGVNERQIGWAGGYNKAVEDCKTALTKAAKELKNG